MNKKNNKLNILHLISSLEVGGAEKLLIDLLKNTDSADNVNFTVVVMNNHVNEGLKKELLKIGCDVHFLNRVESHKHPKYFFKLLNIIKKNNIKIIHSHNYGSKMWAILCKLLNPQLKLVHTVHDVSIFNNLSKFNIYLHKKFINKNIAISDAVINDTLKYKINKITKIYNGINIKKFSSAEIQKKDLNYLSIINIARITHTKKGQDILIKALKLCKDKGLKIKCDFVGGVYKYDKDSFEYLNNLVNDLGLAEEVKFLGNREDVPELLAQSNLFVLPSRYEGLGLVVLEAMATKLPVIASNIDGPAELIQHGENGLLFESENPSDLAEKISYLYNNQEKMEYMKDNAYEFVQKFDISVMNREYCRVYRFLIK